MITIEQCRAARGLLGWTQQNLADSCGLSKTAINNFEKGHSEIKAESLRAICLAFESLGLEFLGEHGLRRRTEHARLLKGDDALNLLMDDIHPSLKPHDLLCIGPVEDQTSRRISPDRLTRHLSLVGQNRQTLRILCAEGTAASAFGPLDSCRWTSKSVCRNQPAMFIYGSKVAIELWNGRSVVVIESPEAAQAERERFDLLWNESARPPAARDSGAPKPLATRDR
ncbi:MAG: helix-turn-helix domain-containing protein [Alphaproteobacteria bacterium]|nr:helix-turn-helix domain-containing protein [Alphaproteobacteria bacterium]